MGPCCEDEDDMPELGVCGAAGRLAGAPQTRTASAGNSIPILAAEAQGTVKWILALGPSLCLGVPLVVTRLLLAV